MEGKGNLQEETEMIDKIWKTEIKILGDSLKSKMEK